MRELDLVALTRDLPEQGLERGDVGTLIHRYADGGTYEVEFVTAAGATIAVLTLDEGAIRPLVGANCSMCARWQSRYNSPKSRQAYGPRGAPAWDGRLQASPIPEDILIKERIAELARWVNFAQQRPKLQ